MLAAATLVVGLLVMPMAAGAPPAGAAAQTATEGGLEEVGLMPSALEVSSPPLGGGAEGTDQGSDGQPPPMIVDATHSLGLSIGKRTMSGRNNEDWLALYDLDRMLLVDIIRQPKALPPVQTWAIDEERERVYIPLLQTSLNDASCPVGSMYTFTYSARDGQRRLQQECVVVQGFESPCGQLCSILPFTVYGVSYDAASKRLYVSGTDVTDGHRSSGEGLGAGTSDNAGAPLLIRQVNTATVPHRLEWEFDLQQTGCARRDGAAGRAPRFVQRIGGDVLAYCSDQRFGRYSTTGRQGYVVRIRLEQGPDGVARPASARRMLALAGNVVAMADPVSKDVLLATSDPANGNAVWVFDPLAERFVGVVTGGFGGQATGNFASGFDATRGRMYVLTEGGILLAPTRARPLASGLIYPVVANPQRLKHFTQASSESKPPVPIAVAPKRGRLFVPVWRTANCPQAPGRRCPHYVVVEDHVSDPPPIPPSDPDLLTAQVPERPGVTDVNASGQSSAVGGRVVVVGGIPRVVNSVSPTCHQFDPSGSQDDTNGNYLLSHQEPDAFDGRCLADVLVTPGHRETLLAGTKADVGSGRGATATAAGQSSPPSDQVTDRDVRTVGECAESRPDQVDGWGRRPPATGAAGPANDALVRPLWSGMQAGRDGFWSGAQQARDGLHPAHQGACSGAHDGLAAAGVPDARAGTAGTDNRGYPISGVACVDFSGQPVRQTHEAFPHGGGQSAAFAASASCDATANRVAASAGSAGLALPDAAAPEVTVARMSSSIESRRTSEGQITVAVAVAEGVRVGPLFVGEVRSLAVTKAKGVTGSASGVLVRQWCRVSLAGQNDSEPTTGCVDADSDENRAFVDQLNQQLQKVQIRIPDAQAGGTPGGYQALATKSADELAADQTVNDDDSHEVAGMQVVVYNDGADGRNRLIVQLAGVHAESRYGIVVLPTFPDGGGPPGGPPVPPATPPAVDPGPLPPAVDPGPPLAGPLPDSFVEEGPVVFETVRTSSGFRPPAVTPSRPASGAPRIIRVPIEILRDGINLLVQHPREFGMLLVLWSLLATPAYLGLRRRNFARALAA